MSICWLFWLIITTRRWSVWANAHLSKTWVLRNIYISGYIISNTHWQISSLSTLELCSHAGWDGSQMGGSSAKSASLCCLLSTFSPQRSWSNGGHIREHLDSCFKSNFKHYYESNTRIKLSVQTWLHKLPDWMTAFHVQHTWAQFNQSRNSKYWKICRGNIMIFDLSEGWNHFSFL